MKKFLTLAFISLVLLSSVSCAGNKKEAAAGGSWLPFDQAMQTAQQGGKFIVMDVYTDWCKWCKVMDEKTYADPAVAALMKESFVGVKLNAERGNKVTYKGTQYTEIELARNFNVSGFPTTMFLESNGDVIGAIPGYIPPEEFVKILKYLSSGSYKTMKFQDYLGSLQ
jgi:thioredoxin-related protein